MSEYKEWYYKLSDGTLVKEKKPCRPGDHVHLISMPGCFKVYECHLSHFVIKKKGKWRNISWDDFKCLMGAEKALRQEKDWLVLGVILEHAYEKNQVKKMNGKSPEQILGGAVLMDSMNFNKKKE